jgi:ATP-dependent Clp protease ATP-binding subunit ClpX
MEIEKSKLNCSFCGKDQAKVKKLIAGPNIYICNECVDLCNDILIEEEQQESKYETKDVKPKEIFEYLDQIIVGQNEAKGAYLLLFIITIKELIPKMIRK